MALKAVQVEVLTGPQGGGKSETMRRETIQSTGLYLFALPIKDLIDEQSVDFRRDAPDLYTIKVYSEPGKPATAKRLDEARRDIEGRGLTSAVIFTTHATLMDHSLHGFDDWHVRVDEAPGAVQAGKFNIGVSNRPWFKETFQLEGGEGYEWSVVSLKVKKPDWAAVERDTGAKPLAEFIKQAAQPSRAFVRAKTWDDHDEFEWFSMWSPLELSNFKSVQFAGSSYTNSIGFQAASILYEDILGVRTREIKPQRIGQPDIKIHFFTRGHDGSTWFWGQHDGLKALVPVTDFLAGKLPESAFWSGNEIIETVMMGRLKGEFIRPLAAGLNKYREAQACSMIFSAKALQQDKPLREVFRLTKEKIERAREAESISQFVMRGAIRNIDFDGNYEIFLYSEKQAINLRDYLFEIGFSRVEIVAVEEVGIMDLSRAKAPEQTQPSPEEIAAKAVARRDRDAERKRKSREAKREAEGLPKRKAGRPKKSI